MSRIFEALQRAELESKDIFNPEPELAGEELFTTDVSEPLANKTFVDADKIAQHPWRPLLVSLPTFAERGECVEQFRSLRSQIYLQRFETKLKTILVSSGIPSEGKTFVAANLAMSLARNNDRRVLLIDGDLRRPNIHKLLGAPLSPGLADYLTGTATPTAIMQRCSTPTMSENPTVPAISNVTFIPAGDCGANSPEIAGNHRIEDLIATVSPHFDWILIDSPPVLAVTDAVDLARATDAVLLVARGATTPYDVAQRAQAAFSNSRILGFVLNAVKDPPRSGHYYDYYTREEQKTVHERGRG